MAAPVIAEKDPAGHSVHDEPPARGSRAAQPLDTAPAESTMILYLRSIACYLHPAHAVRKKNTNLLTGLWRGGEEEERGGKEGGVSA